MFMYIYICLIIIENFFIMKNKFSLMLTILGLLIISCEAEKSNEETFNQTFKRIGLSDPFAFNYTIKTTEGELTTLSSQQVKDYISGKLFKENDIT